MGKKSLISRERRFRIRRGLNWGGSPLPPENYENPRKDRVPLLNPVPPCPKKKEIRQS